MVSMISKISGNLRDGQDCWGSGKLEMRLPRAIRPVCGLDDCCPSIEPGGLTSVSPLRSRKMKSFGSSFLASAPGASEALEGDVGVDDCTWYLSPPSTLLNMHPMTTVEGRGHSDGVASGCDPRTITVGTYDKNQTTTEFSAHNCVVNA